MNEIAIVNYGVGNLRSLEKAFAATGNTAIVSDDVAVLCRAKGLVLPGVGAFANCMKELTARGFDSLVIERASAGVPLLGVCVGMQLLFEESEEFGMARGLGLLKGRARRFPHDVLVPHVGWNQVHQKSDHALLSDIENDSFFYFVHSYFCEPSDASCVVGTTDYGLDYASIIVAGSICGVQFHPEKSQAAGLKLLANFARQTRC